MLQRGAVRHSAPLAACSPKVSASPGPRSCNNKSVNGSISWLRSSASGPISHNVQPFVGGDGAIYIFFITSFAVTPDNNDTDLSVRVGRAETVSGPFEFVTPQLLDVDGAPIRKDNPSAIVYANGQPVFFRRRSCALRCAGAETAR